MAEASKPENSRVRKPLTPERLKELLHYDLETGVFRWRVDMMAGNFLNLRESDKSTNGANRNPPSNNTSGKKGVSWDKSRSLWAVEIKHQGARHRLGRFATLEAAAAAYRAKSLELFGEFTRAA